jgi:hypothetical protein
LYHQERTVTPTRATSIRLPLRALAAGALAQVAGVEAEAIRF